MADPSKFAELARKESQDAGSAANGGDLGWQQKGALPGSLDKAAFGLNKDQVSGVVESPSGLHILADRDPARRDQAAGRGQDQLTGEVRKQLAAVRSRKWPAS